MKFISPFPYIYFLISALVLVPGFYFLVTHGLRLSVDFTGGAVMELSTSQKINEAELRKQLGSTYELREVTYSDKNLVLHGSELSNDQKDRVLSQIKKLDDKATLVQFESVGGVLSKELITKTITAIAIVAVSITLYVSYRFKNAMFGVSAVLAMLHDSSVLLGVFSILGVFQQMEVGTLFVTALLTTLSFSVHDTIVVYDRIRELHRNHKDASMDEMADRSVLETLPRSLNNSLTIIIMLLALVLLGGATTREFSLALLVGAVTGTYSSTFTAVPLVVVWSRISQRLARRKK